MADDAYDRNEGVIDMDACVRPLVEAMSGARQRERTVGHAPILGVCPPTESA